MLADGSVSATEQADLILFNAPAQSRARRAAGIRQRGGAEKPEKNKAGADHRAVRMQAQQPAVVEKDPEELPVCGPGHRGEQIDTLPQLLSGKAGGGNKRLFRPRMSARDRGTGSDPARFPFRAWLPIMYRCDNFCTYCIVPCVRGRERSRRPADVLTEFRDPVAGLQGDHAAGAECEQLWQGLEQPIDFADLLSCCAKSRATTTCAL